MAIAGYADAQIVNAAVIADVATGRGIGERGALLGVMCAMGESSLRNIDYGDWETNGVRNPDGSPTSSIGLFQQQKWWGTPAERMDARYAAGAFFDALVRVPAWATLAPTLAIHRAQINADPNHYAKYEAPARAVLSFISSTRAKGGRFMPAPNIEWVRDGVGFTPGAAASFRRAEAGWGAPIRCNSTYRDWGLQLSMWQAWTAWVAGRGPKPNHSRALHPDESMHCKGLALDTDLWLRVGFNVHMADHGWIRTAAWDPTEQHHFEYQWWRDNHRNEGAPASDNAKPIPKEWDEMASKDEIKDAVRDVVRDVVREVNRNDVPRGIYIWTQNRGGALIDPTVGGVPLAGEEAEAALAIYGRGPEVNDRQWDVALNLATRLAEQQAARVAAAMVAQKG